MAKSDLRQPLDKDLSRNVGTLTLEAWKRERAKSDAVHVVRPQVHAPGVAS